MRLLAREKQNDIIDAFNSTSRYLDDLLIIDTIYNTRYNITDGSQNISC